MRIHRDGTISITEYDERAFARLNAEQRALPIEDLAALVTERADRIQKREEERAWKVLANDVTASLFKAMVGVAPDAS